MANLKVIFWLFWDFLFFSFNLKSGFSARFLWEWSERNFQNIFCPGHGPFSYHIVYNDCTRINEPQVWRLHIYFVGVYTLMSTMLCWWMGTLAATVICDTTINIDQKQTNNKTLGLLYHIYHITVTHITIDQSLKMANIVVLWHWRVLWKLQS